MEGLSTSACEEVSGSSENPQVREALIMDFHEVPALWATTGPTSLQSLSLDERL